MAGDRKKNQNNRLGNLMLPTLKITCCSRPPQLSLPTAHTGVANYQEVIGRRKEWDKSRCVQVCLHVYFFQKTVSIRTQSFTHTSLQIMWFGADWIILVTERILLSSWMKGTGLSIVLPVCQPLFRAAEWSFYVRNCNKGSALLLRIHWELSGHICSKTFRNSVVQLINELLNLREKEEWLCYCCLNKKSSSNNWTCCWGLSFLLWCC